MVRLAAPREFPFFTKDAIYVDRSNWSSDRLKAILPKTPQPKLFKIVKGAAKMCIAEYAFFLIRNSCRS